MQRSLRQLLIATGLALAAGVGWAQPAASEAAPAQPEPASLVAVVPIHGEIDFGLEKSLERRVQEALDAGAQVVLFEMDSYGGRLDSGIAMGDFINGLKTRAGGKVKTVAYVDKHAISAGAMISLACQEIVMRTGTEIGDCQAIMVNPQTQSMEAAPEKIQSMVRAVMRKYAMSNGYPVLLAEGMVDPAYDIFQVRFPDGQVKYMSAQQLEELKPDEKSAVEKKLIVPKGRLLTMNDKEAHDFGFSRASVSGLDEAVRLYGKPGAAPVRYDTNWSEEMVRFLNSTAVSSVLMFIGIIALYMAFKTPGLGIPEAVAVVCFGVLFLSKYAVGLATVMDLVLFAAGVILLAVEIFLIPGFGLIGLAGIGCILAALVLSLQKFTVPKYDFEMAILVHNLFVVLGTLLAATIGFMIVARFLPNTPFLNRLVLTSAQTPEGGYVVVSAEQRGLIGKHGVAMSILRPAGRAEIDGAPCDVIADGDFIEPGTRILVTDVRGNRIVVRKV